MILLTAFSVRVKPGPVISRGLPTWTCCHSHLWGERHCLNSGSSLNALNKQAKYVFYVIIIAVWKGQPSLLLPNSGIFEGCSIVSTLRGFENFFYFVDVNNTLKALLFVFNLSSFLSPFASMYFRSFRKLVSYVHIKDVLKAVFLPSAKKVWKILYALKIYKIISFILDL